MAILQLHKATKSYGQKEVLSNVSLELSTGNILGVFGSNGSGKSTLLQLMFGLLNADEIDLNLNGNTLNPSDVIKTKRIAYLPQHPFLPKFSKVRELIPMYHDSEEKQDALFYNPSIASIATKHVGDLSHGERKYFETMMLGHLDHPFLFLDEPFSMLEPLQTEALKTFLIQLKKTKGLLITDHYYQDVLDITTHNMVLKEGKSYPVKGVADLKKFEYLRK